MVFILFPLFVIVFLLSMPAFMDLAVETLKLLFWVINFVFMHLVVATLACCILVLISTISDIWVAIVVFIGLISAYAIKFELD
jgi:hypothetical protein